MCFCCLRDCGEDEDEDEGSTAKKLLSSVSENDPLLSLRHENPVQSTEVEG